jgi:hypothetical protein
MRFVVRYISSRGSAKNLDAAEAKRLAAAGLSIVAVYQEGTSFMLGGHPRGVAAAVSAKAAATACGMPDGRPIYFALDTDPAGLMSAEWFAVHAFCDGAASILGRANVGVYGAYAAIERLCPKWAAWGWQTYAWSGGKWSPKAQLQQYKNNVSVCGGMIDHDRATTADYGGWKPGQTVPPPLRVLADADKAWLAGTFAQAVRL